MYGWGEIKLLLRFRQACWLFAAPDSGSVPVSGETTYRELCEKTIAVVVDPGVVIFFAPKDDRSPRKTCCATRAIANLRISATANC
jgi:hypothetical protein